MLDHFTQYVGSAPDLSPAVLCGIAHMQTGEGVWYPRGGTRAVAEALIRLAGELGVECCTAATACRRSRPAATRGLGGHARRRPARCRSRPSSPTATPCGLIASCWPARPRQTGSRTAAATRRLARASSSTWASTAVTTSFCITTSSSRAIRTRSSTSSTARASRPPTRRATSAPRPRTEPDVAPPGGEALYVLVHTPYLRPHHDWKTLYPRISPDDPREAQDDRRPRRHRDADPVERWLTPQDIHDRYRVLDGAIYGLASHGRFTGAFKPANRSPDVGRLYLAGGAAHPGPGNAHGPDVRLDRRRYARPGRCRGTGPRTAGTAPGRSQTPAGMLQSHRLAATWAEVAFLATGSSMNSFTSDTRTSRRAANSRLVRSRSLARADLPGSSASSASTPGVSAASFPRRPGLASGARARPAAAGPLIVVANHPSWWDPLIGLVLTEFMPAWRIHYVPIDVNGLAQYPFLERLGFFGVETGTTPGQPRFPASEPGHPCPAPSRSSGSRRRASSSILAIDPSGSSQASATWPTRQSAATIVPLALEYPFWNDRCPEALARFGEPIAITARRSETPQAGAAGSNKALEKTQDRLAEEARRRDPAAFLTLIGGTAGVGGVYDSWRRLRQRSAANRSIPSIGSRKDLLLASTGLRKVGETHEPIENSW